MYLDIERGILNLEVLGAKFASFFLRNCGSPFSCSLCVVVMQESVQCLGHFGPKFRLPDPAVKSRSKDSSSRNVTFR